jgi:hypothetical protein
MCHRNAAINQNSDYFNRFMFEDAKRTMKSIYDKDRSRAK